MCTLIKITFAIYVIATLPLGVFGASAELEKPCGILGSAHLRRICVASYTWELKLKYRDAHVEPGEPFGVFSFAGEENRYFVSFHSSALLNCSRFAVIDINTYRCVQDGGDSGVINVEEGFIQCVPMHLKMVDDLVSLCNETDTKPNIFAALHYAGDKLFDPDKDGSKGRGAFGSGAASLLSSPPSPWPWLFSALVLILVQSYFRHDVARKIQI